VEQGASPFFCIFCIFSFFTIYFYVNINKERIYLDYSASTPLDDEVFEVIHANLRGTFGNASSIHSYGRAAKVVLEESREKIARSIGAETSELFFTSGGTESDNHALVGRALAQRRSCGNDHIIVSSIEHHAVLDCAEYLRELGFRISIVPVDHDGFVHADSIENLITDKTCIISVMHANNETGAIQPVKEIAALAKKHGIPFHSDTVQTIGKIPVNVNDLGVDLIAISAHKIYGPKGIGALYIRQGTELDAFLHGGSQERKNRPGTENVPLIAGFAKAIERAEEIREKMYASAVRLRSGLLGIITSTCQGVITNSDETRSLPHILSISLDPSFYEIESETLLLNMDLRGVAVSSGSACTSGSVQPSHVLLAMGRDTKTTQTTVRFSFGKFTTIEEVKRAGETYCSIVQSFLKKK
jgi:cysteine desulfurase